MENNYVMTIIVITFSLVGFLSAQDGMFEYPYYLLDTHSPDKNCWMGMDDKGTWPVPVYPEQLLVGPTPALNISGVTIPIDQWVELKFPGRIVDGPGDDILLVELDQMGEQALVFLTNGFGEEYLLGLASVPNTGAKGPTQIWFNIAGLSLPFVPSAIRIVGTDLRGGSPGFDLAYIKARTYTDCGYLACNPYPPDGAENVPTDAILSWSTVNSADSHFIYFGGSPVDVNAAPVNNSPQDTNSLDPGTLELGKTYYWRVDEINKDQTSSPRTGNIWKFTVADYFVVDDFESYRIQQLSDNWTPIDQASLRISNYSEFVHTCRQSMDFFYYCDNLFESEAVYNFHGAQDWLSAGVKAIEIFFYGTETNNPGVQMYLTLNDGNVKMAVPYDGEPNDITRETWQLWRVDLENISDVNFSRIEHISIGFTNRTSNLSLSSAGTVYFDDIILTPYSCTQQNRPAADFNCDCIVGFIDLDEMAYNWLDKGYNIYPVAAPNTPLAWYKFDGDTKDSAGSAHCLVNGSPSFDTGFYNQAIKFDGYEDSVEIPNAEDLFSQISTAITIAFWQKGEDSRHHTDTLFCSDFQYGVFDPAIAINLGCWKGTGRYNWDCGSPWPFDKRLSGEHRYRGEWLGRWNHWAFTKDARDGKMQLFFNCQLIDSRTGSNTLITRVHSFKIGSGWYGGYDGFIDDLQIFNYALSQPEIAYIATHGTGVFDQWIISEADLNSDNQVDFIDFALLAENWLDRYLQP